MEYRSAKTLSYIAMAGIGLLGLAYVFAVITGIAQIASPGSTLPTSDRISSWLLIQGLIALLQVPVYVCAAVVFLMWLFRTYKNLAALRADRTEFTPGWAVGWWFIPFANLVKPFQVVRSVWAESDPDVEMETGFLASVQAGAPGFMALWWAMWILANIVSNITSRVYDPQDMRTTELSGYLFIIDGALWVAASILAIKVIKTITDRQEERHRRAGAIAPPGPPPPPTFGGQP